MVSYKLHDIAKRIDLPCPEALAELEITGVNELYQAQSNQITFCDSARAIKTDQRCEAAVVLVPSPLTDRFENTWAVPDSDVAKKYMVRVMALFEREQQVIGVHPTAVIDETANVDSTAAIGPYVVIGRYAEVGAQAQLHAHVSIGDGAQIGSGVCIEPNSSVYRNCRIGDNTKIQANVVVGSRGFGLIEDSGNVTQIPHLGAVVVGADCEIGSGTVVDRGTFSDTVLADQVVTGDNCHIAHNVTIGSHTVMGPGTAIAGSTTLGKWCHIVGFCAVGNHLTLADKVKVGVHCFVTSSVETEGTYISTMFPAKEASEWSRQYRRLLKVMKR